MYVVLNKAKELFQSSVLLKKIWKVLSFRKKNWEPNEESFPYQKNLASAPRNQRFSCVCVCVVGGGMEKEKTE